MLLLFFSFRSTSSSQCIRYINFLSSGEKQHIIEEASEAIKKTNKFLTIEESKEILYYNGNGVYDPGGELLIEKEAERLLGYELSNKNLSEIKGHIMRRKLVK